LIDEDIIVYDNFISTEYHEQIQNLVARPSFNWTYHQNISSQNKDNKEYFGFSHNLFDANMEIWFSEHSDKLKLLISEIQKTANCSKVLRARLDMTLYNEKKLIHEPHIDFIQHKNVSAIYYLNNSDGDTIIYNEKELHGKYTIKKKISPKANRLVLFKGEFVHTGSSPSNHNNRILINSNYN
tara:strand:+ start:82 stop:630 length:549 start_codon:yes stop_codon:yes gene_type:complete